MSSGFTLALEPTSKPVGLVAPGGNTSTRPKPDTMYVSSSTPGDGSKIETADGPLTSGDSCVGHEAVGAWPGGNVSVHANSSLNATIAALLASGKSATPCAPEPRFDTVRSAVTAL